MRSRPSRPRRNSPAGLGRVVAVHDGLLGLGAGVGGVSDPRNALGVLGRGRGGAVCSGHARAFKLLCDAANVPCAVISGWASADGSPVAPGADGDSKNAGNLDDGSGAQDTSPRWVHVDD